MIQKNYFDINKYMITDYSDQAKSIIYYFISLFYATGKEEVCCSLKLEQLTIIYQLWCLKNNKTGLLPISQIKIGIHNFNLHELMCFVAPFLEYTQNLDMGNKERIINELNFSKVPERYTRDIFNQEYIISDELKELLIEIFRTFGNWQLNELQIEMKSIALPIINSLNKPPKYLDKEVIKGYKYIFNIKDNKIIDFINEYPCKTNEVKQQINANAFLNDFKWYFKLMTTEEQIEFLNTINDFDIEKKKVYKK